MKKKALDKMKSMRDFNHLQNSKRTEKNSEQQLKDTLCKAYDRQLQAPVMLHTARGSFWHLEDMQCMPEAEPLQTSILELQGMNATVIYTQQPRNMPYTHSHT